MSENPTSVGPLEVRWRTEDRQDSYLKISESLYLRLRSSFTSTSSHFQCFINCYLRRKYLQASLYAKLFIGPKSFYFHSKELFSATYELFADALNFSGVLPHFCSLDSDDSLFGSAGIWEKVEKKVNGASGIPPFSKRVTTKVVESCEQNVRIGKPYFRLFILSFHEKSALQRTMKASGGFSGIVLAIFKPKTLAFRHQRELFGAEGGATSELWFPVCETAIVVWVNEPYRILFPFSCDIEECLAVWVKELVGDVSGLDCTGLRRAFPEDCRSGDTKSGILNELYKKSYHG